MGFRTTGVLVAVFLALLGYLYFFEIRGADERRAEEQQAGHILALEADRVVGLTFIKKDSVLVFEKRDGRWLCVSPLEADGDDGALSGVIQAAGNLDRQGVVATAEEVRSSKASLAEFGLEDPEFTLVVRQENAAPDTVYWGATSPTQRYAYVQRFRRGEILMVNAWARNSVDRSLFQLRDKRVLAFDRDAVRKLELVHPDETVTLVKQGGVWKMVEPVEDGVAAEAVEQMLNRLHMALFREVVVEEAENLDRYGLADPELVVSVFEGEDLTVKSLRVGRRADESRFPPSYAKDADREMVFTVGHTFVKDLGKRAGDLRFKRIFAFDPSGLDSIRMAYGDSLVVARRDSSGAWVVEKPRLHFVLEESVRDLVLHVHRLEPERFVAESLEAPGRYGFENPALRASFYRNGELLQEIRVGEKDRHVYLVGHTRPQVVEVEPRDLLKLKLELMPLQPESVEPDTVRLDAAGMP